MGIKNLKDTELGRILVVGQTDANEALWQIAARAERVPVAGHDDSAPAVHGLRTLWMRSVARGIDIPNGFQAPFLDPTLLDAFVPHGDFNGKFSLAIFGNSANVTLDPEQRIELTPMHDHPHYKPPTPRTNEVLLVAPFLLAAGTLSIPQPNALAGILPGLNITERVDLDRDGIVYTADVVPPLTGAPIKTRVRLSLRGGKPSLTLLPNKLDADATLAWLAQWQRLAAVAESARDSAWARLSYEVGDTVPALTWPVQTNGTAMRVRWGDVLLPPGLVVVTLSDQPAESQLLAPEQVLTLLPEDAKLASDGRTITLRAGSAPNADLVYRYDASAVPVERLYFTQPLPMVHMPGAVRKALRAAYGSTVVTDTQALHGFLQEADGWVELPFTEEPLLPARLVSQSGDATAPARGSFLLGNRRRELHEPGASAHQVPWSMRIDVPSKFKINFVFAIAGRLQSAEIGLQGVAAQARGLVWLANRAPDGDDALPLADAASDAFVDVVLDRAVSAPAAPFILHGVTLVAPGRPAKGWDDAATPRWKRAPTLDRGFGFSVDLGVLAGAPTTARAWLHHPSLPVINCMPATRSDTNSPRPHASRALSLFEQPLAKLIMLEAAGMAPAIHPQQRAAFAVMKGDRQALAVLSLPGIELKPESPVSYLASGRYGLPVLDEAFARAALPLPPGAEPPPAPAAVTALDRHGLRVLWDEQARRRSNAATQADLMFGPGNLNTALPLAAQALAAPRTLTASASVSAAVAINGSTLAMGSVAFAQAAPVWSWSAGGDDLLRGPTAALDFSTPGKVKINSGTDQLSGWSFAERLRGSVTFDGRGVGWDATVVLVGEVALRAMTIEQAGAAVTRTLVSSIEPLPLGGTGDTPWELAFTDLAMPAPGPGNWTPGTTDARLAGMEQGWSWSLYEAGQWQPQTLRLHRIFQFAPAALAGLTIDAAGRVAGMEVEGALTLGLAGDATNSRCRVKLTFVRNPPASTLMLTTITGLGQPKGGLQWDLRPENEGSVITSGVAQLSALPVLDAAGVRLTHVTLATTLFGSRTSIALLDIAAGQTAVSQRLSAPGTALELGLTRLDLDLAEARLGIIGFEARLREGVLVTLLETPPVGDVKGSVRATLDWFGNPSGWQVAIDDLRRTVRMSEPQGAAIEIFPGAPDGRIVDGVLCLTLAGPSPSATFPICTHFFEAMFQASDALRVSHLMYGACDLLRFDGTLGRTSLVTWPALNVASVGSASSVKVEFGSADAVMHHAAFLLSDHRLPGSAVERALSKGLALKAPTPGNAPVAWVAEATHTLSWRSGGPDGPETLRRKVQCVHTVQLWSGTHLASALQRRGQEFGFTPSYVGNAADADFPHPGVRRVSLAFAGLFEPGLGRLIDKLDEGWLILGNMTALCPAQAKALADLYQPLHLPFISAVADSARLAPLRSALGVPLASAASVLRMSRHDTLGLPMRIDGGLATPAGRVASLPEPLPIPFAMAALPADTLSGTALGEGWFHSAGAAPEAGLHVEQLHFHGPASKRPRMPHPFPRAAVMLDFFKRWQAADALPALSVLVHFTGAGNKYATKVSLVQVQPAPTAAAAAAHNGGTELIVGSAAGLAREWVDDALSGPRHARQLLAVAMEHTGEPTFMVLRHAGQERAFTGIDLPLRQPDQLGYAARPLRAVQTFRIDGRLSWPEARTGGAGRKMQLLTGWGPRTPFQHTGLGVGGFRSRLLPSRVAGEVFGFAAQQVTVQAVAAPAGAVWLQEWDKVLFANGPVDAEDAAPAAFDSPVAVRPLAPACHAVAAAVARLDPAFARRDAVLMQTYLPPLIEEIDLPTRLGTLTESGMRVLRTWDDGLGRDDVPALAGPALTRTLRTPRPPGIPPNSGDVRRWARTVGWYGEPDTSCLVMKGAWDMLAADPGSGGIAPWCILIGKPARARLEPLIVGQEQGWRGAVRVACEVLQFDTAGKPERHGDPAQFIIDALLHAGEQVRAGLRGNEEWDVFHEVAAIGTHALEFLMDKAFRRLGPAVPRRFECAWLVTSGPFPAAGRKDVTLPAYKAPATLDPTAFRQLTLAVPQPVEDHYPLPLVERSVFFSDPAFDQQLSRVKAISDTVHLSTKGLISFWIDRPSATPTESVVLRGVSDDRLPATLSLSASVKRKDDRTGATTALWFAFEPLAASIEIANGAFLSLPLTILTDAKGQRVLPGDTVRLELKSAADTTKSVMLFLPIRSQSSLTAPQALYSLISVDSETPRAWCARHSAAPQPNDLATHIGGGDTVLRRALFKWRMTDKFGKTRLAYSICKVDLATDATHVPDVLEYEFKQ